MFVETMTLTFALAFLTMIILLPIGILAGYYFYYSKGWLKLVFEVLVWLPLVLPPTVLGFYLLLALSPQSPLGAFLLEHFNVKLVFSFGGILLGSVIFGLPFMIQPIKSGLFALSDNLQRASFTLGRGKLYTLFKVLLPNIKPSILIACVGTFIHAVGEFGVVMMIGGNIEGKTKVASIAIVDEVEMINYSLAHQYALTLFLTSFILLFVMLYINKRFLNDRA
ncbi:molybdate ABC transporter permease subunit [Helicobacter brantae]|uniref:Molybdenum transport system permease n=1 Tax=Helicobacter brantae TaxID=375927 RepID=A0A3D8J3E3_9HELI|nr:molybdate ABC transporter permease subunit [Helicobacter brantae]RDU72052.1 molybdate ABC transporter permease subunit [Helicobacter brantae]